MGAGIPGVPGGGPGAHGRPRPAFAGVDKRVQLDTMKPGSIHDLLELMVQRGASDLHLKVGSRPGLRIDGTIIPVGRDRFTPEDLEQMVRDLLSEEQFAEFCRAGDLDFSYAVRDLSRFRVNALFQRGSMGLVIRHIPRSVPTIKGLGLPQICARLAEKDRGLVLVTGPTGSGKSTTLAAMVNHINSTRRGHIVTMEDPIEFVHSDMLCWVTQREIGSDAKDFPGALRRALRQDPDVIMIGEMRDLETIALAVTAAETGHLVFATLHTTSAVQTVSRIVDVFPSHQQEQVRMQVAETLQGIVSQSLLPRVHGGQAVAMEILVATDAVRAVIRENKPAQLRNLMQTGAREGMQTLEGALNELLALGEISQETALQKANFPRQIDGEEEATSSRRPGAWPSP